MPSFNSWLNCLRAPSLTCTQYILGDVKRAVEKISPKSGRILPKLMEKAEIGCRDYMQRNRMDKKFVRPKTKDGILAIVCYTLDMKVLLKNDSAPNFYDLVNRSLQTWDTELYAFMQGYLFFLVSGLERIAALKQQQFFRGLPAQNLKMIQNHYRLDAAIRFSGITSISGSEKIAKNFAGKGGIVLRITASSARSIRDLSAFPEEDEALLLPGFQGVVTSEPKLTGKRWYVDIRETRSLYCY